MTPDAIMEIASRAAEASKKQSREGTQSRLTGGNTPMASDKSKMVV